MTRVTVIEIDLPTCANTYGVSPCAAVLGSTGTKKCFNCIRTCQDRANFVETITTIRFCEPTASVDFYLADGTPKVTIPSMRSIQFTPALVRPGIDVGMRETVNVSFVDHPHSDAGLDNYLADRSTDPAPEQN